MAFIRSFTVAIAIQPVQVAIWAPPSCTIFGCTRVFEGVLAAFSLISLCVRYFVGFRNPVSVIPEVTWFVRQSEHIAQDLLGQEQARTRQARARREQGVTYRVLGPCGLRCTGDRGLGSSAVFPKFVITVSYAAAMRRRSWAGLLVLPLSAAEGAGLRSWWASGQVQPDRPCGARDEGSPPGEAGRALALHCASCRRWAEVLFAVLPWSCKPRDDRL